MSRVSARKETPALISYVGRSPACSFAARYFPEPGFIVTALAMYSLPS
jgi:hypothetical protein